MAEELQHITGTRAEIYEGLMPQIKGLITGETDLVANLANVCAALKSGLGFFWIGFYIKKEDELVLGPFQGPIACTRIRSGKGVCGTAWSENRTIVVDDVDAFPGHIACSSDSRSEIVVPVVKNGEVVAVLDVDSDQLSDFDATDAKHLENLCEWLAEFF